MNARGQYGHPTKCSRYGATGVGALYHSVGDRADAVKQLASDWSGLYQNLASQVGEITPDVGSPSGYHITTQREWDAHPPDAKKVEWWRSYAKPIINAWVKFKREQLGDHTFANDYIAFAERWQTNWDVYERWKNKLDALRAEAQKRGFAISAPPPAELPTTVWTDLSKSASAAATGVGDAWTFIKYAAWGLLGIGAVVALSSVAQNLRTGRDPAEQYVRMIRRGGRSVAGAALPPLRRALPPDESPVEGS